MKVKKIQIAIKFKNSKSEETKNSNCDETKNNLIVMKLKN